MEEAELIPFDVINKVRTLLWMSVCHPKATKYNWFVKGILPCMTRLNARLAVISTPSTDDSHISLMFKEDEISKMYFIQSVTELWCKECKEGGKSARECMIAGHELDKLPRHKPRRNMMISMKMMISDSAVETELAGSALTGTKAWDPKYLEPAIQLMTEQPLNVSDAQFDQVYTMVDPSAGVSDFVILSFALLPSGTYVELGLSVRSGR